MATAALCAGYLGVAEAHGAQNGASQQDRGFHEKIQRLDADNEHGSGCAELHREWLGIDASAA